MNKIIFIMSYLIIVASNTAYADFELAGTWIFDKEATEEQLKRTHLWNERTELFILNITDTIYKFEETKLTVLLQTEIQESAYTVQSKNNNILTIACGDVTIPIIFQTEDTIQMEGFYDEMVDKCIIWKRSKEDIDINNLAVERMKEYERKMAKRKSEQEEREKASELWRENFEEKIEKQRIELEKAKELKRSFIDVKFSHISEKGYVKVLITNKSGKDIQNLEGGFNVETKEGKYLFSTGLTIQKMPGEVYLANGQTQEQSPYGMEDKLEVMEILKNNPESIVFFFEAKEITYSDGTKEDRLEELEY